MRIPFNLNLKELNSVIALIHGGYASGKTHMIGDMLNHEKNYGEVKFLNIQGEDGTLSIANSGLGEIGETVTTYSDFNEAIVEYKQKNVRAVGVDSVKALSKLVMTHVLGQYRLPVVGGRDNEWSPIHFAMEDITNKLRQAAPRVLCVCPSDKSMNQLDGQTYITPDLPGRQAAGSAGWFDFVMYLTADAVSPTKVERRLLIRPNGKIITRQRLPRQITQDIPVPHGGGGWKNFLDAVEHSLKGE